MLMTEDVDLGLKIPDTHNFTVMEKVLMVIGEVDIGLRKSTITHINQESMVDCCVYLLLLFLFVNLFMEIKEVIVVVITEDAYLGIKRPATLTFTIV